MTEQPFPKEQHPVNITLKPGVISVELNPNVDWTINLSCPNDLLDRLELASVSKELDQQCDTLLPIEWPKAYRISPDISFDDRKLVIVVNRNTRHPFAPLSHCALDEEPVMENYCTIILTLLAEDNRGCGDEPGMMPCL